MKIMTKTYDIRKIDELHKLRADNYEKTKHLSNEELIKLSNENGKRLREKAQALKQKMKENIEIIKAV